MQSFLMFFSCQSQSTSSPKKSVQSIFVDNKLQSTNETENDGKGIKQRKRLSLSQQKEQIQRIKKKVNQIKNMIPNQRKVYQRQFIKNNMISKDKLKQNIYILQKTWSQQYTLYLQDQIKQTMPPINNSKILDKNQTLANNLKQKLHYYLLNQKLWTFISLLYGGGPQIIKNVHLPLTILPIVPIKTNHAFPYLNSGLQCLISIGQFNYYFKNKHFRQIQYQTKKDKKYFSQNTMRLIRLIEQNPNKVQNFPEFYELFQQIFDTRIQYNCEQFIDAYLKNLQAQLNPQEQNQISKKFNSSYEAWNYYKTTHPSIIDLLFVGQYSKFLKCNNCETKMVQYIPFMNIELQISKNSLQGCLNKLTMQQKVNQLQYCERCKMKQKFTKQVFISNSPAYLFINLKRFVENRNLSDESISYGLRLNIEKYCKNSKGNEYSLNSIIVNQGSSYYCITNRGNVWYYINDQDCKVVNIEDQLNLNAYILVYKKNKN